MLVSRKNVFDVESIRRDFPALNQNIKGHPLVYLDNAATTQKPTAVLEAINKFYAEDCSNIHRGVHELSERATREYEGARVKAQKFIGAASEREVIFVRGTTEAINLVAQTFGRKNVGAGDEIIISTMEHHSNIVPWQMLCEEKGAQLKIIPISDAGELDLEAYRKLFSPRTKLVSVVHLSNALGTLNPIKDMVKVAHQNGVPVMVDGAQSVPHLPVDVRDLDCDFFTFSGHKIYGPTGIGILYGREAILEKMPPFMGGGDMISSVSFAKTTYNSLPYKFEAGTPNISAAIGLGAALDYVAGIGFQDIGRHEHEVLVYASEQVARVPGIRLIGTAREKGSVLSFVFDDIHPHDVGTLLDQEGVAIRTGHHCAQPTMDRLDVPATCRASFAIYNTRTEVDALVRALHKVREVFA